MQSCLPNGYRFQNGDALVIEHEAEIIRLLFEEYAQGKSIYALVRQMKERNILPLTGGTGWNVDLIKSTLQNVLYCGYEKIPAIVSWELYQKVQKRQEENSWRRPKKKEYAFSGKLVCSCCGAEYEVKSKTGLDKNKLTWACKRYWVQGKKTCDNIQVSEVYIRALFLKILNRMLVCPGLYQKEQDFREKSKVTISLEEFDEAIIQKRRQEPMPIAELFDLYLSRASEQISRIETDNFEEQAAEQTAMMEQYISQLEHPVMRMGEQTFDKLVRQITVYPDRSLEFELKNGIKIRDQIPKNEMKREITYKEVFGYEYRNGTYISKRSRPGQ